MLERITFEKFTAFEKLDIEFSPGINVFIGENGTEKFISAVLPNLFRALTFVPAWINKSKTSGFAL